jgi:tetratricopeptide (TPR) repeat protein
VEPPAAELLRRERNRLLLAQAEQNLSRRPGDPALLRRRAEIRVRCGGFAAAAADLERSLQAAGDNHWRWYACAALYLYAGDDASYRRVALQAYRRFEQDPKLFVRERCAKLCLLAPDPVLPPDALAPVIDRFIAENTEPLHFGWSKLSKALCDYRAGRYPSAAQWLERSREHTPFNRLGEATYLLLRAMTNQRLNEPAAARSDLEAARKVIEQELTEPRENDLDGCGDVLPLHKLLREAEALLAGSAAP